MKKKIEPFILTGFEDKRDVPDIISEKINEIIDWINAEEEQREKEFIDED